MNVLWVTPREYSRIRDAFDDSTRICVCRGEHHCVDEPKLFAAIQDVIGFAPLGNWYIKIAWTEPRLMSRAKWQPFTERSPSRR